MVNVVPGRDPALRDLSPMFTHGGVLRLRKDACLNGERANAFRV